MPRIKGKKNSTGASYHILAMNRRKRMVTRDSGQVVNLVEVERLATRITGSRVKAVEWIDRTHPLLGDISPRQAVELQRGKEVLGLLINAAGG